VRPLLLVITFLILTSPSVAATPKISIDVHDAQLTDVISLIASQAGINVVADSSLKSDKVTLHLRDVTFDDALTVLVQSHDLQVHRQNGTLMIGTSASMNRRYDAGNDPRSATTVVLTLAHGIPDDVAKELENGLPEGTVIVPDKRTQSIIVTGNHDTVARARALTLALDAAEYDGKERNVAHVYRLRYVRPSQVINDLKGMLPDNSYIPDDAQNAILVTGNEAAQHVAQSFVRSIDVPSPQVLFEVRVADLQPINEQSNIGVQFGGYDLAGKPLYGAAGYAFARNSLAINATINALVSQGHARILATPKLVTLNNKEADLLIGQTYPVVYYDARLGGQQVQFVDIGVKLRLTPMIGVDGSVTAEMHPEYSAIQDFVGGYPVIANRRVDSTLRVENNQTIVLGGLLRDIDSQTISKLPGLADIPIIGKIFQNRQHTRERDEIIFLITPHVIYPNGPVPNR
jgi:type IV pilus assembly protein PilQ